MRRSRSPIARWAARTPAVRTARTIIGGVSLGWQMLAAVVWFGFLVAAFPRALRKWIDGDPSEAPVVVLVGTMAVIFVILVVIAFVGAPRNARVDRKRYAAHAAESQANRPASVAPPANTATPGSLAPVAPALPSSDRELRREARGEQMLRFLGADSEKIEQAKSARRARLVDRHRRRQQAAAQAEQAAAKQAAASEQREQTNRALGR